MALKTCVIGNNSLHDIALQLKYTGKYNECTHYLYTECFSNYFQHNTRQHDGRKIEALKFNRHCDRHNFVTGGVF